MWSSSPSTGGRSSTPPTCATLKRSSGTSARTSRLELVEFNGETDHAHLHITHSPPAHRRRVQPRQPRQQVNGVSATILRRDHPPGPPLLAWPSVVSVLPRRLPRSLNPTSAAAGQTVTITGSGFGTTQGSGYVTFLDDGISWGAPGNTATFAPLTWANGSISFTVPSQSGNSGEFVVTPGSTATVLVTTSAGTSQPLDLLITAATDPAIATTTTSSTTSTSTTTSTIAAG